MCPRASQAGAWPTKHGLLTTNYEPKSPSRRASDQSDEKIVIVRGAHYKDWGTGQPIVFSHGWPLSADDWDAQMLYFLNRGFRVIAHDRRGHGRSSQTDSGHDMDHYADDLATLVEKLDLRNAIHVGHSTGGGEVVHYIARHGESGWPKQRSSPRCPR